jgi:phosphatidylglycerophosphate synthase
VTIPPADRDRLAFKAYEIEELADVYFFRPLGMIGARAARRLRLTPTAVTAIGTAIGIAGGALLFEPSARLTGFALLIVHSILDSSDGQLARMTGRASEFGRMLDGVGGYLTHAAIYVALLASALAGGAAGAAIAIALAAAISNAVHAQMYDYHRGTYTAIAIKGTPTFTATPARLAIVRAYERMQRMVCGGHRAVEQRIAARAVDGKVRDDDRAVYRRSFYALVRRWNVLGDNTRFYAIGVLAAFGRLDWFFTFVLVPMNAAFAALWLWQRRADRRFLERL